MLFNAFLPLVLTSLSVQALDPIRPHAKQSRANDEAPTATAIIGSTHTNTLSEHTTLTQHYQRSQPALTSATVNVASNSIKDVRWDLHNTGTESVAQKAGEKDGNLAVDSGWAVEQHLSRKAAEHLATGDTTSPNTERSNRLAARSRLGRRMTLTNGRDTDDGAKCDCSGKASGTYKTATIVLSVFIGLEVLFALLSVCFGSLFMVLVGLYFG